MYKVKAKNVILTLILFVTFMLFITEFCTKYSFANSSENESEVTEWNIKITSDTKDLTSKDTKDIIFKVQDNPNVARGKMAPGSTAIATIELDLNNTKYAVEFDLQADTSKLYGNFKLSAKINDEPYKIGETKIFELEDNDAFNETNGKKTITLILTWENDNSTNVTDTLLGTSCDNISIPITWTAKQHI